MDIDSAATFFVGSILVCAGLTIIGLMIVFLNNVFTQYWKPINWTIFKYHPSEVQYLDPRMDNPASNTEIKIK